MMPDMAGLSVSLPLAAQAIRESQSIVLACHVNPDGDALGSMLGLARGLLPLGKDITILSQDGVPETLKFLPGSSSVSLTSSLSTFDLAIVLDSGDLARVGDKVVPVIQRAARIIDVDHHVSSGAFGDIRVVHSQAASTSEIVYALLLELGLPVTKEVATSLFTGVITDTGSFRFQNVTPNTFRIAAALLEHGAPPAYISEHVFENRTFAATAILGCALATMKQYADGKLVTAVVSSDDFNRLSARDVDTEGIVNYVRGVRGANAGVLFREVGDGTIRVSLRARDNVDVAAIASRFGGGGHRMASGCTIKGSVADAEQAIVSAILAVLNRDNGSSL